MDVPIIDVAPLTGGSGDRQAVGRAIDEACRQHGFFLVTGHGIDSGSTTQLIELARGFFGLDAAEKEAVAMRHGGRAWRGWFPLGGELTSGVPDNKEGYYFGAELPPEDPRVRQGLPLHGPNLFPSRPKELREAVLGTMERFSTLGQQVMGGVALGLGLDQGWFARELTADPVVLFRIFHYPPGVAVAPDRWGVAEHTDYGLLTMLLQDDTGGLEVRGPQGWRSLPAEPGTLVCNIGDMLERMTGGRYRSTPHRVRSPSARGRISCPFFFDPGWDAQVRPLPLAVDDRPSVPGDRWDGADVLRLEGTYGDYLLSKVSKVFPALHDWVLPADRSS